MEGSKKATKSTNAPDIISSLFGPPTQPPKFICKKGNYKHGRGRILSVNVTADKRSGLFKMNGGARIVNGFASERGFGSSDTFCLKVEYTCQNGRTGSSEIRDDLALGIGNRLFGGTTLIRIRYEEGLGSIRLLGYKDRGIIGCMKQKNLTPLLTIEVGRDICRGAVEDLKSRRDERIRRKEDASDFKYYLQECARRNPVFKIKWQIYDFYKKFEQKIERKLIQNLWKVNDKSVKSVKIRLLNYYKTLKPKLIKLELIKFFQKSVS